MRIEHLPTMSVIPYARNARINDQTVSSVAASIQEFGFQNPIIIDADNVIIAGHTRHKAALSLGLTDVPCIRALGLSDEQVKAYRLLDNKLAEKSDWDTELLRLELSELSFDFQPFDVDFGLQEETPEAQEDDCEPTDADKVETQIQYGDLIEIGKHRLYCGDSTDAETIQKLKEHPTMKPIALVAEAILNHTDSNDFVFDSFLGSGTTMLAAHQLGRVCYGVEIEPRYCQVIIDRMLAQDDGLDVYINGEPYVR